MFPTRPLSYQTQTAIIEHFEANFRITLVARTPQLRTAEKSAPLRCEKLILDDFSTTINNHTYRIGLIREYGEHPIPKVHLEQNKEGGVNHDLNKYGFRVPLVECGVMDGDIMSPRTMDKEERYDTAHVETPLMRNHVIAKVALSLLERREIVLTEQEKMLVDGEHQLIRAMLNFSVQNVREFLAESVALLQPFRCKKRNSRPVYTPWVQLVIENQARQDFLRIPYRTHLCQTMKRLNNILLGDRFLPVQVKELSVSFSEVLRVPVELRLKAQNFKTSSVLLEENCLTPLFRNQTIEKLTIPNDFDDSSFAEGTLVQNSRKIFIDGHGDDQHVLSTMLTTLPNFYIYAIRQCVIINAKNYYDLVQSWVARDRPIGATFVIGVRIHMIKTLIKKCLELFKNRNHGKIYKNTVKVPLENSLRLNVNFSQANRMDRERGEVSNFDTWILRATIIGN